MDKQNEGIKDPHYEEIPYDMGGWAAVRNRGEWKADHNEKRRRLISCTMVTWKIHWFKAKGDGNDEGLIYKVLKKWE